MATDTQEAAQAVAGSSHNVAGAEAGPRMPQLDFDTFPNQIFWLLVTLVAIYLVLSRVALPRIGSILAERQGAITNDILAAEDLNAKALEAEEVYNKALADARSEAVTIAAQARADIQGDLNDAIAKADAEIAAKAAEGEKAIAEIRASALQAVEVVAKDTASEIVTVLGGKSDAKNVAAAVTARLKG